MKRRIAVWLVMALCAALAGIAAMAESQDALSVEPEEPLLTDAFCEDDAALSLDLELDALEGLQPELVQPPEDSADEAGGLESNRIVVKKLVCYQITGGVATVVSADRAICEANIPATVKGYPVKHIAPRAFYDCPELWTVTVPESVVDIGENAFNNCVALVDVKLPVSLVDIGPYAFANCTKISHFDLPEGLTEISEGLFENCTMMWKIAIPGSMKAIGKAAFRNCVALKEFALPAGLEAIGESAFEGCEAMKRVTIPGGVAVIGDRAFKGCVELSKLTLQEGVNAIGFGAFWNCDSLKNAGLPASLKRIDALAFGDCQDLMKVTIPGSVTSVGRGAFFHCPDLETVSIKSGVAEIGTHAFAQCNALTKVAIPESVSAMGDDVFTIGHDASIDEAGEITLTAPLKQPKGLTVYGRPDTKASEYAAKHGIPFVVLKIQATSVSIAEGKSGTLYVGHPYQLTAVQEPANAETKVKWSSSSSSVTVSNSGLLTPKRSGKAVITVKTENDKKATFNVNVVDAKSVHIDQGSTVTMRVGETLQLSATVQPEGVDSKLTWSSGSKKIATVSQAGLVTAVKKGTATITVKTANGKKAKISIKVTE